MDEQLVYTITKILDESREELISAHPSLSSLSDPEYICSQLPIPLHPGAEKYYTEQGLLKTGVTPKPGAWTNFPKTKKPGLQHSAVLAFSMPDYLIIFYFRISRSKFTISIAPIAQSNPLFPLFVPALSIACSIVSVVSTPNITGTLLARETWAIPFETSLHT